MARHSCRFLWLCSLWLIQVSNADIPIHKICSLQNYDYFNLTAVTWALSLEPDQCLPVPPQDDYSNINLLSACELRMGFCKKLLMSGPCYNSSVCQKSEAEPPPTLSLGAYVDNPFSLSGVVNEFRANFYNGSDYTTKSKTPCHLKTAISFQCNHSASWPLPHSSLNVIAKAPTPRVLHYDNITCQMRITFDYAGACKERRKKDYLSVGTVLIIIFFITIFLYLVLGAMLNSLRGQSGMQLVPHFEFWASLPGYIKAGCIFTFYCQCRSGTDSYAQI